MYVLPHGSQETSIARSLVNLLPPKEEEMFAKALRLLASRLPPLESSLCAVCYLKSNYILAKVENTKFMLIKYNPNREAFVLH